MRGRSLPEEARPRCIGDDGKHGSHGKMGGFKANEPVLVHFHLGGEPLILFHDLLAEVALVTQFRHLVDLSFKKIDVLFLILEQALK